MRAFLTAAFEAACLLTFWGACLFFWSFVA